MKKSEVIRAWAGILAGRAPSLSIEITKECPLRCPGCYAFDAAHLGGTTQLRELSDYRGDDLVARVLALIDDLGHFTSPWSVAIQWFVTVNSKRCCRRSRAVACIPRWLRAHSGFPEAWLKYKKLNVVVSIDGLQPEHDARRKPATYDRILKNIKGTRVTVHCTITSQIAERPGYLDEFLGFWTSRPEIAKVWFSIFTPQRGATDPEILTPSQRATTIAELRQLRLKYPKLDMPEAVIRELASPPRIQKIASSQEPPKSSQPISTRMSLHASLEETLTAPNAVVSHPWGWPPSAITALPVALTAGQIFMASDRLGKAVEEPPKKVLTQTSHSLNDSSVQHPCA